MIQDLVSDASSISDLNLTDNGRLIPTTHSTFLFGSEALLTGSQGQVSSDSHTLFSHVGCQKHLRLGQLEKSDAWPYPKNCNSC